MGKPWEISVNFPMIMISMSKKSLSEGASDVLKP